MPINVDEALSAPALESEITWTTTDVLFYHLSIGASADELQFTFERELQAVPTFGLVAGAGPSVGIRKPPEMSLPGIDVDLRKVLHVGQSITLDRPIPTEARARTSQRVVNILDKQKAAIIELEKVVEDDDGPMWTELSRIWVHGEGNFGGSAGSQESSAEPTEQLAAIASQTSAEQAALYRLNGDYNPLHIDPRFAKQAGLAQPILHGLATFGIAALGVIRNLCHGDPRRLTHIQADFSHPVVPGQGLHTSVSKTIAEDGLRFSTSICGTENHALKNGIVRVTD